MKRISASGGPRRRPVGDGNDDADAVFAHVSDLHGQLTPRYQVYYDNPTSTPDFNFGDDDRVVERGGRIPCSQRETRRTPRGLRRVYAHERRHVPRLRRDHLHRWASDARSRQRPRRARHLCPGNWDYSNEAAEDGNFVELMDDLDAPILANNLYDWETDERLYDAYRILDIGGLSVGSSG